MFTQFRNTKTMRGGAEAEAEAEDNTNMDQYISNLKNSILAYTNVYTRNRSKDKQMATKNLANSYMNIKNLQTEKKFSEDINIKITEIMDEATTLYKATTGLDLPATTDVLDKRILDMAATDTSEGTATEEAVTEEAVTLLTPTTTAATSAEKPTQQDAIETAISDPEVSALKQLLTDLLANKVVRTKAIAALEALQTALKAQPVVQGGARKPRKKRSSKKKRRGSSKKRRSSSK